MNRKDLAPHFTSHYISEIPIIRNEPIKIIFPLVINGADPGHGNGKLMCQRHTYRRMGNNRRMEAVANLL